MVIHQNAESASGISPIFDKMIHSDGLKGSTIVVIGCTTDSSMNYLRDSLCHWASISAPDDFIASNIIVTDSMSYASVNPLSPTDCKDEKFVAIIVNSVTVAIANSAIRVKPLVYTMMDSDEFSYVLMNSPNYKEASIKKIPDGIKIILS